MTTRRTIPLPRALRSRGLLAVALGAASVLGFAPFSWWFLPIATFALLFHLWLEAATPRRAAALGFLFGLGYFLAGVSWVYVSLHDFGAMPAPVAALTTLIFCGYLALYPSLAGYLFAATSLANPLRLMLLGPALWTLAEWVRGWLFTGFPWLALGYAQIPAGPLAGFAPVFGIYGITLATTVSAGLVCAILQDNRSTKQGIARWRWAFVLVALWGCGHLLKQVSWTHPAGAPVSVSLLQGNVPQDLKWQPERVGRTLESYRELTRSSRARLIILPETALPLFLDNVPRAYLADLAAHAKDNDGDILIGVPERLPDGRYFNSVVSLGTAPPQRYRKSHLVPFGEFIPLRTLIGGIVSRLAIPLQDFARGTPDQQPLAVAGLRIAVNICYEDAFGEEIIRQLPAADVLVNVSNVAWFGRSIAPQQHEQISQARALETGRYMLRATNTGVTAVIDERGQVLKRADEFTRATVTHDVLPFTGITPYVRWGNLAVLLACAALVAVALALGRGAAALRRR